MKVFKANRIDSPKRKCFWKNLGRLLISVCLLAKFHGNLVLKLIRVLRKVRVDKRKAEKLIIVR